MPVTDYTPTTANVATLLRTYTKDRYTAVTGSFSDDTEPTGDQVTDMIDEALQEVALAVGPDIPDYLPDNPDADHDFLRNCAKTVVGLLSAMNVVLSKTPDQISDPRSPYAVLEKRYENLRKTLLNAISDARGKAALSGGDGDLSVATDVEPMPMDGFDSCLPPLGMRTIW